MTATGTGDSDQIGSRRGGGWTARSSNSARGHGETGRTVSSETGRRRDNRSESNSTSEGPDWFFFQAEDGIRDVAVTRVQTCALPISGGEKEGGTCVAGSCPHRGARAATNGYPDLEGR